MKDLGQIGVIGLGLLGGSVSLAVLRCFPGVRVVGYSHRRTTRAKARSLGVASEVVDDVGSAARGCDVVVLATPIFTFPQIFRAIGPHLRPGAVVTDVGSTKVLPGRWAAKLLPAGVDYVGSHPIAGSEQRGVEYARDDLFEKAVCILTAHKKTRGPAVRLLKSFWTRLGCRVELMTAAAHDRILAGVSHVPHVTAAALVNAVASEQLRFAGRGFMDTSRVASGPASIWTDVLLANSGNVARGIDRVISELTRLKNAVAEGDQRAVDRLLNRAVRKRKAMIEYKLRKKELMS